MSTTMANISASLVKELREKTGAPMMDCKNALTEAKGDLEEAVVLLRKKGVSVAAKKATRVTSEGSVAQYIHAGGKIGVLVEVNCESDFVARTEDFKELVHDIAMHIAASDPKFVRKEDVTAADIEREKDIYRAQAVATGKPANIVEKMVAGKMEKFYEEVCLLEQPFIKDQTVSIAQLIAAQGRQARREHRRPPLRAFQSGRRGRDDRHYQAGGAKAGRRIIQGRFGAPFDLCSPVAG